MQRDVSAVLVAFFGLIFGALFTLVQLPNLVSAHTGCPAVGTINGTASADVLAGDSGNGAGHDHEDDLHGLGGSDQVLGYSCADSLFGNDSWDSVHGSYGNDEVYGGDGHENVSDGGCLPGYCGELFGGEGHDLVVGGPGKDYLNDDTNTSTDNDILRGEGFDDSLEAQDSDTSDSADGGAGTDHCYVDSFVGGPSDSWSNCESIN